MLTLHARKTTEYCRTSWSRGHPARGTYNPVDACISFAQLAENVSQRTQLSERISYRGRARHAQISFDVSADNIANVCDHPYESAVCDFTGDRTARLLWATWTSIGEDTR